MYGKATSGILKDTVVVNANKIVEVVVLWRFRASAAHEDVERRAARIAGALLFTLAGYVAVISVTSLLGYSEPKPTILGSPFWSLPQSSCRGLRKRSGCCQELQAVLP